MFAGTITLLKEPLDDGFSNWFQSDRLPGLVVETTQTDLGTARPVQAGTAAGHITTTDRDIAIGRDEDAEPVAIDIEEFEGRERVATDWVADPTDTGLFIPESVAGDGRLDFPLNLLLNVTGQVPERQRVAIGELFTDWREANSLGDVWMNGTQAGDDTTIGYHGAASERDTPTIGLGFERAFRGTTIRGVIYESGYIACYDAATATEFVRFIDEKILPYCDSADADEDAQTTLGEATDDEVCLECGRETETTDEGVCMVCHDHAEDEEVSADA